MQANTGGANDILESTLNGQWFLALCWQALVQNEAMLAQESVAKKQ
jgi:hypothetical protein